MPKRMKPANDISRRIFLRRATAVSVAVASVTRPSLAAVAGTAAQAPRRLAFQHTHTGESIALVYAERDAYVPEALLALNHFLRDHYSGDVGMIAPGLLDQLHRLQQTLGSDQPFQVISGYRSPATNTTLRQTRGGGVAKHSLHMEGRAIDIRLPDVALAKLRDAALSLRAGGVGYYPGERFVHVDNGPIRRW